MTRRAQPAAPRIWLDLVRTKRSHRQEGGLARRGSADVVAAQHRDALCRGELPDLDGARFEATIMDSHEAMKPQRCVDCGIIGLPPRWLI